MQNEHHTHLNQDDEAVEDTRLVTKAEEAPESGQLHLSILYIQQATTYYTLEEALSTWIYLMISKALQLNLIVDSPTNETPLAPPW
jgi:hypothetical protein